jgi:dolichyl-phosphooligosaccharide-protein glycotransferase
VSVLNEKEYLGDVVPLEEISVEPTEKVKEPLVVGQKISEDLPISIENKDDTAIDFSAWKKKVKGFMKKKASAEQKEDTNEDSFDLSNIKEKTTNFFKQIGKPRAKKERSDGEEFSIASVVAYSKKNAKWLIPLAFILIAIILSSYFRLMPVYLPITDQWAENSVNNFYQQQLRQQIDAQYPNLPQANRDALVQTEFQALVAGDTGQFTQDKAQLSQQFKANFQDENGDTYLLAIDPYLWYSQARNVVNYGHLGDTIIDGESYFSLRDGRLPKKSSVQLHPYVAAYLFEFLSFFNKNVSLMYALFLVPAIIIGLALIPTFFIGKKIGGNVGGLFAALFLAINGPLLGRTPAGFSDTDAYSVFFPLLIAWLFLEAYTTTNKRNRWIYIGIAGLSVGLYAATWTGWSTMFLFVLATLVLVSGARLCINFFKAKYKFSKNMLTTPYIKNNALLFAGFFVSSGVFVWVFRGLDVFQSGFMRPIKFIALKEVGIKSIWPNVLTTVAEFNTTSFSHIIGQMGGNLFFFLAAVGLLLTLLIKSKDGKYDWAYFIFLAIWLVSTIYAFTKGTRFAILIAPPFALALGSAFGGIYEKTAELLHKGVHISRPISNLLIIGLLALFLIAPMGQAKQIALNEVPSMNDAWWNTLTKIKDDATDAIITSWWDFGHWFVAVTERRVTFDGGDQGERIHWVGNSLLTADEQESIGILRMLNCAQETAPHQLNEFTGDSLQSVQMIYEVLPIAEREEARQKYIQLGLTEEQAATMLEMTHCEDLIPSYYITSEDMIGKAGVWGHFGSWDFEKATMYQNTVKLPRAEAVAYLAENFDIDEAEAASLHTEIITADPDRWIAPWPGYLSGRQQCQTIGAGQLRCILSTGSGSISVLINLLTDTAEIEGNPGVVPNSIVYPAGESVNHIELNGEKAGFSLILIPSGNSYIAIMADPLQAGSMFTRLFFLEAHGLKCFSKFDDVQQVSGGKIITWKVDYACLQENLIY